MANYSDAINNAKSAGYSDSEIANFLADKEPGIAKARSAGYDDTAILGHLGGAGSPPAPQDDSSSTLASAAFPGLSLAKAGLSAAKDAYNNPADVAKSAASGLAQGAATAMGLPGDVASLAHAVAPQALIDKIKGIPGAQSLYNHLPTSQGIRDDAEQNDRSLVSPNYDPQSATGRYTQAITRNAGPGLASGMGVVPTLVPSVAGQGAYDATGSHLAEGLANVGGGLGTELAMAARARKALMPLISGQQVKADAKAVYNGPELASATVSPDSLKDMAVNVDQTLARRQFDPDAMGEVRKIIDNRWHNADQPQTIADLQNSRARLSELAQGAPSTQTSAAKVVKGHLDDYLNNITPQHIVSGDPVGAAALLKTANAGYHAQSSAKTVENLIGNATVDDNAANSAMNLGNRIRQSFKPLLKNDAAKLRGMGYGDDVVNAVTQVNKGDTSTNILRHASNMLGGGGGIASTLIGHGVAMGTGGAAGYQEGGLPGMLAGSALGAAPGQLLRMAANSRTLKMAQRVQEQLLSTAPANAAIVARNTITKAANKAAVKSSLLKGGIGSGVIALNRILKGG